MGFRLLAPHAQDQFPQLIQLFYSMDNEAASGRAAYILAGAGEEAVPIFMQALTNENWVLRWRAAFNLATMREHAKPAVPLLIQTLQDTNDLTAATAARALGTLRFDPALCVPALAAALVKSTNSRVDFEAIRALGAFGTNAIPAIPVLLQDKDPQDMNRVDWVSNALHYIAPNSAAQLVE
jgi:HEAT repeat protein